MLQSQHDRAQAVFAQNAGIGREGLGDRPRLEVVSRIVAEGDAALEIDPAPCKVRLLCEPRFHVRFAEVVYDIPVPGEGEIAFGSEVQTIAEDEASRSPDLPGIAHVQEKPLLPIV